MAVRLNPSFSNATHSAACACVVPTRQFSTKLVLTHLASQVHGSSCLSASSSTDGGKWFKTWPIAPRSFASSVIEGNCIAYSNISCSRISVGSSAIVGFCPCLDQPYAPVHEEAQVCCCFVATRPRGAPIRDAVVSHVRAVAND